MSDILVIGDVHAPFIHKPTFSKILEHLEKRKKKPDHIVQIGDLYDLYSYSKFPRSLDVMTPKEEVIAGRLCAEEFWRMIKKRAPKAICHQLVGNHDVRPYKRIQEKCPEILSIVDLGAMWRFDGVNTLLNPREILKIGDIAFHHGWSSQPGFHAKLFGMKTVVGHLHRPSINYITDYGRDNIIWEANCAYIADPEQEALKYTPTKFTKWIRGILEIDSLGPKFIIL